MGREFYLKCFAHFNGDPNDSQNWRQSTPENSSFASINWQYEFVLFNPTGIFGLSKPYSSFPSPIRRWVKEGYPNANFDFYDCTTEAGGRLYDPDEVSYAIDCVLKILMQRTAELPYQYLHGDKGSKWFKVLNWVWPPLKIDPTRDKDLAEAEIIEQTCYEACKPSLDLLLECCQKAKEWKQPILTGWAD